MVRGYLGAALAVALSGQATAQILEGPARVVDGDTLKVASQTVRLHAIDAPEAHHQCRDIQGQSWPCGAAATAALSELVRGGVRCEGRDVDRYGRLVAKCFSDGQDVAAALVRSGAAFAYPSYGLDYVDAEKEALFAGRGVWAGGRDRARILIAAPAVEGDCAIKGNISANGRIYHLPGQENYDRTCIAPARGERWFCSEAEARAAGWRRARR